MKLYSFFILIISVVSAIPQDPELGYKLMPYFKKARAWEELLSLESLNTDKIDICTKFYTTKPRWSVLDKNMYSTYLRNFKVDSTEIFQKLLRFNRERIIITIDNTNIFTNLSIV